MPLENLIPAAAGAIFGINMQGINDRRQLEQQRKLQALQIEGSKELTAYNIEQQKRLWEMTNYPAQMEQLRKAGLNPALLYGMSGGGGASTNINAGTVSGGNAPVGGGEIMGGVGMALQAALQTAQIENIKAQTEKVKAEVPKTQAETASLTQGIENQKAVEALTRVQTEIAQVTASVSRQTIKEQMRNWENIAEKGTEEINALKLQNNLSEAQFNDKIKLLKTEIAVNSIKGALMNAQKNNTEQDTQNKIQEILESQARIKTMAEQLMIEWDKLSNQTRMTTAQIGEIGANDEGWEILKGILPSMLIPIGRGFQQHTPIRGFK